MKYAEYHVVHGAEYVEGKGWKGWAIMRGGTRIGIVQNLRDVDACVVAHKAAHPEGGAA